MLDANQRHGVYLGLEWSFCRIEAVTLGGDESASVRVRAGNTADLRIQLAPEETCQVRPGFLDAYRGDLDDAGNRLRRWLLRYGMPDVLRQDAGYPKVQWNAFGATGKTPGSWDPVETKYYPWIDDLALLSFEEVMIDVGWWQADEPDSDPADWPSGMRKAADYAHQKGLRFGLYWTDNLDMARAEDRQRRAGRIGRLFQDYGVDLWRSDCTRGEQRRELADLASQLQKDRNALFQELRGLSPEERGRKMAEHSGKMEQLADEALQNATALLTPDQKDKLKQITGEPFEPERPGSSPQPRGDRPRQTP